MTSHSPMWHICLAFKSLVPLAGPPCRQPPPHAKHCPCRGVWKLSTSAPKKPCRCSTSAPEAFGHLGMLTLRHHKYAVTAEAGVPQEPGNAETHAESLLLLTPASPGHAQIDLFGSSGTPENDTFLMFCQHVPGGVMIRTTQNSS